MRTTKGARIVIVAAITAVTQPLQPKPHFSGAPSRAATRPPCAPTRPAA